MPARGSHAGDAPAGELVAATAEASAVTSSVIWSPWTEMADSPSGEGAGRRLGDPSSIEYLLPWQAQLIVPSDTLPTWHALVGAGAS